MNRRRSRREDRAFPQRRRGEKGKHGTEEENIIQGEGKRKRESQLSCQEERRKNPA